MYDSHWKRPPPRKHDNARLIAHMIRSRPHGITTDRVRSRGILASWKPSTLASSSSPRATLSAAGISSTRANANAKMQATVVLVKQEKAAFS